MRTMLLFVALVALAASRPAAAGAIPYFARKYQVTCQTCHVAPPKLNAFGEGFRDRGYRMPPGFPSRRTVPFAIWASARRDALNGETEVGDAVRTYVNKLEVISGGSAGLRGLTYFVEWRPVSLEARTRDGRVDLRDRSGRFEDVFLTFAADRLEVTLGQFRQVNQVDVSLRLGLSEPLALSAALPGSDAGLARDSAGRLSPADARRLSLRGFSPAGRSPAVRVGWNQQVGGGWVWKTSAALPLPGELSLPLTREARSEASNELELEAKGVIVESFLRRGTTSLGSHLFYDHGDRYLANAVATLNRGPLFGTVIGGVERSGGELDARWSLEAEYVPGYHFAVGGRLEDRAGDAAEAALLPYLNLHFPGTRFTVRLTAEQRIQAGRSATLVELATIF